MVMVVGIMREMIENYLGVGFIVSGLRFLKNFFFLMYGIEIKL